MSIEAAAQTGNHHDNIRLVFTRCRDRFRMIVSVLPPTECLENEFLRDLHEQVEQIDLDDTPLQTVRELSLTIASDLEVTAEMWMEQGRTGYAAITDIIGDMQLATRLAGEIEADPDNVATDVLDDTRTPEPAVAS